MESSSPPDLNSIFIPKEKKLWKKKIGPHGRRESSSLGVYLLFVCVVHVLEIIIIPFKLLPPTYFVWIRDDF